MEISKIADNILNAIDNLDLKTSLSDRFNSIIFGNEKK